MKAKLYKTRKATKAALQKDVDDAQKGVTRGKGLAARGKKHDKKHDKKVQPTVLSPDGYFRRWKKHNKQTIVDKGLKKHSLMKKYQARGKFMKENIAKIKKNQAELRKL